MIMPQVRYNFGSHDLYRVSISSDVAIWNYTAPVVEWSTNELWAALVVIRRTLST